MPSSPSILVAYKKSRYQVLVQEEQDPTIERLVSEDHRSVAGLLPSHRAHRQSLDSIVNTLDNLGIDHDLRYRADVHDPSAYDLLVAVGGDGTVLDLSHRTCSTPILSINSDPVSSIGYFSAGTAKDFEPVLREILDDDLSPALLHRFYLELDGRRVGPPVLNDILVSHANPAAVSSYFLSIGDHDAEEQKSSGIWIATPAGSTAAIRSAGGMVLPFDSTNLQYLVREPFRPREGAYRFTRGLQSMEDFLSITSKMHDGKIFIDGPHISFDFPIGHCLRVDPSAPPLPIFGISEKRRTA